MLSFSTTIDEIVERPGVLFELPVIASRPETAIELLGGTDQIRPCLYDGSVRAPSLRLRSDLGHHAVAGERSPCFTLVLRIQRISGDDEDAEPEAKVPSASASGAPSTAAGYDVSLLRAAHECIDYRKRVADMQYLPLGQPTSVNAAFISRYVLSMAAEGSHAGVLARFSWLRHLNERSIPVPPSFVLLPKTMMHSIISTSKKPQIAVATGNALVQEIRKQTFDLKVNARPVIRDPLTTPSEFPGIPTAQLNALIERLRDLFARRPVWTLYSLFAALRAEDDDVKIYAFLQIHQYFRRLLCVVAYYVAKGPFRRAWIRLGYDPRESSDAAVYQVVECELLFQSVVSRLIDACIPEREAPDERATGKDDWLVFVAGGVLSGRVGMQWIDVFANARIRDSVGVRIHPEPDDPAASLAVDYSGTTLIHAKALTTMVDTLHPTSSFDNKNGWISTTVFTKERTRCIELLKTIRTQLLVRPVTAEVKARVLETWKREDFGSRKRAKRSSVTGPPAVVVQQPAHETESNMPSEELLKAASSQVLLRMFQRHAAAGTSLSALLPPSPVHAAESPLPVAAAEAEEVPAMAEL